MIPERCQNGKFFIVSHSNPVTVLELFMGVTNGFCVWSTKQKRVHIVIFHKKLKWISPKTCSDCKKVPGMLDSTSTVCMYILVSMQQQFLLLHPRTTTHELITFLIRDERERERGSFLIDVSGPTTSRISDGCDVSQTNF